MKVSGAFRVGRLNLLTPWKQVFMAVMTIMTVAGPKFFMIFRTERLKVGLYWIKCACLVAQNVMKLIIRPMNGVVRFGVVLVNAPCFAKSLVMLLTASFMKLKDNNALKTSSVNLRRAKEWVSLLSLVFQNSRSQYFARSPRAKPY